MKGGGLHPILGTVMGPARRDRRKLDDKPLENIQPPSLKRRPFKYDAGSLTTSVRNRGRERERERVRVREREGGREGGKVGQQTTSVSCLDVALGPSRTH